jgi:alkylation response protein AidB-like acyl-CoA dehydrogenase
MQFEGARYYLSKIGGGARRAATNIACRRGVQSIHMIRDRDTLTALIDNFARFVRERLVPHEAVQIHGGAGYVSDYEIERFYRDARLFRIYEGTIQIQQLLIARNMIREARR